MQPTTSADALSNLQSFQSSEKAPTDILKEQQTQLGIPGQQQQVSGLRQAITNTTNLLNQVAPSVYGRTQNSLVTNAQAGRQIQNEQAPISQNLQNEGTQLTGAQSDLSTALDKANQMAGLQVTGQQQQLDNLKNIYGALYQKEQDAASAQLEQQKLAEQAREANLSAKSASGGGLDAATLAALLGGGTTPTASPTSTPKAPASGVNQQAAYNSVRSMLATNDKTRILNEINAIRKSAGYGNTTDQFKLSVLQQLSPNLQALGGVLTGSPNGVGQLKQKGFTF